MKRRDFMKGAAAAGLALRFSPRVFSGQAASLGPLPQLAMVEGESPAAITREAVALIGGMKAFVGKGDKVVIKPNIGWDRTPEMAACTNPEVVKTLVELVLDAGAKKAIVIDNTTNQAKRCYVRSGIQEAVKQAGGDILFVDDYRIKKMALKGELLKEWEILLDVIESDKIINVPIAKHHSLCRLTLGAKNWLGATGGARNQFHQDLDKAVVDLAAFFKPRLTVLDAYRILVRNGPQGGRISDTELRKTVVAGTDPVAVDALAASFFDVAPRDLPYLGLARERGLGEFDLGKVRLEKRKI
ncbi:MAG: cytoplasmic protein [Candidatus Aminicenantes bacterium RBG_16_66_30]|nr:MAG: cytoplasmic protein [Candidatus Aminicenantes bacterium RBG_16_66_30]